MTPEERLDSMPEEMRDALKGNHFLASYCDSQIGILWDTFDPTSFEWVRVHSGLEPTPHHQPKTLDDGVILGYGIVDPNEVDGTIGYRRPTFWLREGDFDRATDPETKGDRPADAVPMEHLYFRGTENWSFGEPTVEQAFEGRKQHDSTSLARFLAPFHRMHDSWFEAKAARLLVRWQHNGKVVKDIRGWYEPANK